MALCAGNTAAVNKLTYGWFPMGDFSNTQCIVLFGHNPKKHSWTPIYNQIEAARARGAKVIVLDPRVSEQAEVADLHLRLRAGTDAAMCLGWLKVIFDEELYDKAFVRDWCTGFPMSSRPGLMSIPLSGWKPSPGWTEHSLLKQLAFTPGRTGRLFLDPNYGYADLLYLRHSATFHPSGGHGESRCGWW